MKLDLEWDAELIAWLGTLPKGQRSELVRRALRGATATGQIADPDANRAIVTEELTKALASRPIVAHAAEGDQPVQDDFDAKLGSKLDRMLGGLIKPQSRPDTPGGTD
jgi:hypothetical protein